MVFDKTEYLRLLSEASINDTSKFCAVPLERPKTRGRPSKYYHPLLQKEKILDSTVRRILPKTIADSVSPSGSRFAHLYGLPKTHKEQLAMRPILSATDTYNFPLAKWLDEKLKPLSLNQYTVTDTFHFTNEIHKLKINKDEILVSYDVSSLFTNVPLDETCNRDPGQQSLFKQLVQYDAQSCPYQNGSCRSPKRSHQRSTISV